VATDSDLFLAILALDAYNRGYAAGTDISVEGVGTATKYDDLAIEADGFYGIAYDWNGKTVISYRGTDNFGSGDFTSNGTGASDLTTGWTIALGFTAGTQAGDALQFYRDVTQQTSIYSGAPGNLILTGHSLGGGLAGFVASLTHATGVGFDHEPFSVAAWLQYA
jgi:putative lipase involved disintegration of autophagic bodies